MHVKKNLRILLSLSKGRSKLWKMGYVSVFLVKPFTKLLSKVGVTYVQLSSI